MGRRRKGGFLTALILAVICFVVIYVFMPSVSERFFGSAYNVSQEQVIQNIKDKAMKTLEESMLKAIKEGKVILPDENDLSSVNLSNFDFSIIGLDKKMFDKIDLSDVNLSGIMTKLDNTQ